MNHTIAAEQIQFYRDNGYVVLDNFLDADELETWRQYVGEAVAARGKRKLADGSMMEEDNYYARVSLPSASTCGTTMRACAG